MRFTPALMALAVAAGLSLTWINPAEAAVPAVCAVTDYCFEIRGTEATGAAVSYGLSVFSFGLGVKSGACVAFCFDPSTGYSFKGGTAGTFTASGDAASGFSFVYDSDAGRLVDCDPVTLVVDILGPGGFTCDGCSDTKCTCFTPSASGSLSGNINDPGTFTETVDALPEVDVTTGAAPLALVAGTLFLLLDAGARRSSS